MSSRRCNGAHAGLITAVPTLLHCFTGGGGGAAACWVVLGRTFVTWRELNSERNTLRLRRDFFGGRTAQRNPPTPTPTRQSKVPPGYSTWCMQRCCCYRHVSCPLHHSEQHANTTCASNSCAALCSTHPASPPPFHAAAELADHPGWCLLWVAGGAPHQWTALQQ
jgi:hypothetical protein